MFFKNTYYCLIFNILALSKKYFFVSLEKILHKIRKSVKQNRFTSFLWLLLLPIFAIGKILWELNALGGSYQYSSPIPINYLNSFFPLNLYIGIGVLFLSTYLIFANINAYIHIQTTYSIPLFFCILSLLTSPPEATSTLIALLFMMMSIFQAFTLNEKLKKPFRFFNTGLFVGMSLLFDVHFVIFAVFFPIFLFFIEFTFREFSQYCSGVLIPTLFLFPALYFLGLTPSWQEYFVDLISNFSLSIHLNVLDYIFITILFIFYSIQTLDMFVELRKPKEHTLLHFLFSYFIVALLVGILFYPFSNAYILFTILPVAILYSLSNQNNKSILSLLILITFCFVGLQRLIS